MTYRYEGHSIGDRTRYRPKSELDEWRDERDPIGLLQKALIGGHGVSAEELTQIQDAVQDEVEAAVEFANNSPLPDPSTLYDYIYSVQEEPLTY